MFVLHDVARPAAFELRFDTMLVVDIISNWCEKFEKNDKQ